MKRLAVGILAHVDAGKTTLSEAMLYIGGSIRRLGRVDKKDAFLDNDAQERERGITIFSKQAVLPVGDLLLTLLDTPGHVDFCAEMERTLQVLDYAILVVSGSDGVQGHTYTLWKLLKRYEIPVFVFVNKMDQPENDQKELLLELRARLGEGFVDFSEKGSPEFYEETAVCGEKLLEEFLQQGSISPENIRRGIRERWIFPCFFGSALKLTGVREFLEGLEEYMEIPPRAPEFGARVFKITRDAQGNRLTHMKITGGTLRVKDVLTGSFKTEKDDRENWQEKVNQIRIYSGEKFETVQEAEAGCVCAVTGLSHTRSGEGLGMEEKIYYPLLEPVLVYRILLPEECDAASMLPKFRMLEEEEPELHIYWDEKNREIKVQIMGPVQTEVLQALIRERFDIPVKFDEGSIIYKETVADKVEGVGHFEPLRHYAEVHLLLEPGEPGSGVQICSKCSQDVLDKNWQRLILTHLKEREHVGVLTGSAITDIKITLTAGRAHQKHTEGGDFRQATYRALRQGLMRAHNVLLEPWYEFRLEIPGSMVGRAMNDLEKYGARFELEGQSSEAAVLSGEAPAAQIQAYQKEVTAYTGGIGKLSCVMKGYFPCHNTEEVMEGISYDPLRDVENPSSSVFCAHGAGFVVEWDQVADYMHLESTLEAEDEITEEASGREEGYGQIPGIRPDERKAKSTGQEERSLGLDEIEAILQKTSHANRKESREAGREGWKRTRNRSEASKHAQSRVYKPQPVKEKYLLVDGYNIIFAWQELKELAQINLDGARGKLLDILCNYQAIRKCNLIVVFDAYRLAGHPTEVLEYHNIHVVYTKEAETADHYIERFAHENSQKYHVTVATSDGLEQIIIRGEGCTLMSARDLQEDIRLAGQELLEDYENYQRSQKR